MNSLERAEAADHAAIEELDRLVIVKSTIYTSGERDPRQPLPRPPDQGKTYLMGHDPRLPRMPEKPTLLDFYRLRFGSFARRHHCQSAKLAMQSGQPEKVVLACFLHDISNGALVRCDHG